MVSPDGVVPSWMVGVSTSVNLPLHHKVQKLSSGTISPGWSQKKGHKTVVVVVVVFAPVNLVTEQHMRLLISYFRFFPQILILKHVSTVLQILQAWLQTWGWLNIDLRFLTN